MKNLMSHLAQLRHEVNKGSITLAERQEVVLNLVELLQSTDYVERYLNDSFLGELCWLAKEERNALQEWLRDSDATSELSQSDLKWLKQVTVQSKFLVLKDIAATVALHWLYDRKFSAAASYRWLNNFLFLVDYEEAATTTTQDRDSETEIAEFEKIKAEEHLGSSNGDYLNDTRNTTTHPKSHSGGNLSRGSTASDDLQFKQRMLRTVKWAENATMISERESLFYERLGATYLGSSRYELAKEQYLRAKTFPSFPYSVPVGLAHIYAKLRDDRAALQEYESALTSLREIKELSSKEKATFAECLEAAAILQAKLGEVNRSIQKLEEAKELDPQDPLLCYRLLEAYVDAGSKSQTLGLLNETERSTSSDGDLTMLDVMLIWVLRWRWHPPGYLSLDGLALVLSVAKHDGMMILAILKSFKKLLAYASKRNEGADVANLLCCYGAAMDECDGFSFASRYWGRCCELGFQANGDPAPESTLVAARFLFNHRIYEAKSGLIPVEDFEARSRMLKHLVEKAQPYPWIARRLLFALASFYNQAGRQETAREVLLNLMKISFELLSDVNNGTGISIMAAALFFTGDKLNFLSAVSLRGPKERYPKLSFIPFLVCDGCDAPFEFSESIWHCCRCDDIAFHDKCLKKLQERTLCRFMCSPDHEWMETPPCESEFKELGAGHVRMGGELRDGKRVGGRVVLVEE